MAIFPQLPEHVNLRIVSYITSNEVACTVRLVNRQCASDFRSTNVVRLSQSVPSHAFTQRWSAGSPALKALTLDQRHKLLRLTAASGALVNLELALNSTECPLTDNLELMEAAAAAGHLHICRWLRNKTVWWGASLQRAAGAGRRDGCEWLLSQDNFSTLPAARSAAQAGHVDLMDWFLQRMPLPTKDTLAAQSLIEAAAYGCDLATLQRLCTSWLPAALGAQAAGEAAAQADRLLTGPKHVLVEAAASGPSPDWREKVQWLAGLFPGLQRPECPDVAARPDAVDRLTWLRDQGHPVGEESVAAAASKGNAAALTLLLDVPGVEGDWPAGVAASSGHLAAVQLLVARRGPLDVIALVRAAAEGGQLAVVAWLVDTHSLLVPELGADVAKAAAGSGSVELLAWLHERGCRLPEGVLSAAASRGSEEAVEWLVEHGCPLEDAADAYRNATRAGNLAAVRAMRRLGLRWGPADTLPMWTVTNLQLEVLHWLVEQAGLSIELNEALRAAQTRPERFQRDEVRAWLLEAKRLEGGGDEVQGSQPGWLSWFRSLLGLDS